MGRSPLLFIDDLTVVVGDHEPPIPVVRDVSLEVRHGEFVGLVGESGCGKTMTALAVMQLLPDSFSLRTGSIRLDGEEITTMNESELRRVRGGRIGMIFQEPMTALNPVLTVGFQIREAVRAHASVSRAEALREARRLLELVAMPAPQERIKSYPHELSGGQRQRAMIAMALAAKPSLLIADEPTTALDVTVQAQILELLETLRQSLGLAVLLITHDLGVVAEACDRVVVMYAGKIVEERSVEGLFSRPAHPYSRGLLESLPRLGPGRPAEVLPVIPGQVPEPGTLPSGCAFHPRCSDAWSRCREAEPAVYRANDDGTVRCFLFEQEGQ